MSIEEQTNAANGGDQPRDIARLRRAKIEQYLVESLENADPLQANLGAAASDFMLLGLRLRDAIEQALANSSEPLVGFQRLMPAIEAQLKVTRQWDRLVHLGLQLGKRHGSVGAADTE